jgi:hypothetical protein
MIRTTTNICLLFRASLPTSYWAGAMHTATHLYNRLSSKAVSHPTPHFALYDTAPSYDHLRVFGCACYPNTSATTPHKLSPRSTRCLSLSIPLTTRGIVVLTSPHTASSSLVTSSSTKMCFLLLAPPHPPISTPSLSLIRLPHHPRRPALRRCLHHVRPRRLRSRLFPFHTRPRRPCPRHTRSRRSCQRHAASSTLPAPRAAPSSLLAPRVAPSTPLPVPRAAPSTSATCFPNPALIYHLRGRATPSAPTDPGPSTSVARFAEPAVAYHSREPATPTAPDGPRRPGGSLRAACVPPDRHPPRP